MLKLSYSSQNILLEKVILNKHTSKLSHLADIMTNNVLWFIASVVIVLLIIEIAFTFTVSRKTWMEDRKARYI